MVMDTSSLAQLRATVHLASVSIVSSSVFLAKPLIELARRLEFGKREGFTSTITIGLRGGRWLFVSCIVEQERLMDVHFALCIGKGFVICNHDLADLSHNYPRTA